MIRLAIPLMQTRRQVLALNLDFTTGTLDPRVSFTRASTATRFGSAGQLETVAANQPRFDYDPVTNQPRGLLIEEQRTNLLTYSQDFTNAGWSKPNGLTVGAAAIGPRGAGTMRKIIPGAGLSPSGSWLSQNVSKAAAPTTYTFSAFVKAAEYNRVKVYIRDSANNANRSQVTVNLIGGSVASAAAALGSFTNASVAVQNVGQGVYRIALTCTTSTETGIGAYIFADDSAAAIADGASGIYVDAVQLEAGESASSYIPTTAAAATRAQDLASLSFNYPSSTGTLMCDFSRVNDGAQSAPRSFVAMLQNAGSGHISIRQTTGTARLYAYDYENGVSDGIANIAAAIGNPTRSAVRFATNNLRGAVNGVLGNADAALVGMANTTRMTIGSQNSSYPANAWIKSIRVAGRAMSDAELMAVTL